MRALSWASCDRLANRSLATPCYSKESRREACGATRGIGAWEVCFSPAHPALGSRAKRSQELVISVKTVERHRQNILDKLG